MKANFPNSNHHGSKLLLRNTILIALLLVLLGIRQRPPAWEPTISATLSSRSAPSESLLLSSSSSSSAAAAASPLQQLPACSKAQLDVIRYQLPPETCVNSQAQPWMQDCSFSYATRCPDALWLSDFYRHRYFQSAQQQQQQQHPHNNFVAMYIGCNKGMDAVNALRMGSGNSTIDKNIWRATFTSKMQTKMYPGVCKQEFDEQFFIPAQRRANDVFSHVWMDAQVHCIEAMPSTAKTLAETAQQLGWQSWLKVANAAMGSEDGELYFPDRTDVVGIENNGISTCQQQQEGANNTHCRKVTTYRLDSYTSQHGLKDSDIDLLSVDVEGFDWAVLSGGKETLKRTKYLEFEYNWMGPWSKQSLKDSIEQLKEQGFICYWPGRNGHIWRLTDCWLDYYDLKFWANVACVKSTHVEVAQRMEYMFLRTLAHNRSISYNEANGVVASMKKN